MRQQSTYSGLLILFILLRHCLEIAALAIEDLLILVMIFQSLQICMASILMTREFLHIVDRPAGSKEDSGVFTKLSWPQTSY